MPHLAKLLMAASLLTLAGPLAASPTPVSAPTYHSEPSIPGADGRWDLVSFDPVHHRILIARGDAVTVVDVATNAVRSIGSPVRGHAALAIPGTQLVAVTSGQDDSLRLLDVDDGHEAARISVGKNPDAAIYDPGSRQLLVMNAKGGTVSVVDPLAARVVSTITVKPGLELATMVGPRLLAINDEEASELELIDLSHGTAMPPIALPGCEGPTGIAYDSHAMLLLSACANGQAALVNMRTRKLERLLPIGEGPDTVIFDEQRRRFLVPCGKSGTLAVFAVSKRGSVTRLADVPTEVGARTGAIDEASGRIYLPTARFQPAEPGKRPQPIPGSFHILVLSPTD